jgi:hypothetical protein
VVRYNAFHFALISCRHFACDVVTQAGFIYVVFSSIEIPERYHWGLYVPFCIRIGLMSRVRHPADSLASLDWELEQRTPIKKSLRRVLPIRVVSLGTSKVMSYQNHLANPELMEAGGDTEFTCLVWVL